MFASSVIPDHRVDHPLLSLQNVKCWSCITANRSFMALFRRSKPPNCPSEPSLAFFLVFIKPLTRPWVHNKSKRLNAVGIHQDKKHWRSVKCLKHVLNPGLSLFIQNRRRRHYIGSVIICSVFNIPDGHGRLSWKALSVLQWRFWRGCVWMHLNWWLDSSHSNQLDSPLLRGISQV